MNKRIVFVYSAVILCFCVAAAKMLFVIGDKTYTANVNNSTKTVEIGSVRGTIFDCNSKAMVNNEYVYIAAIPPTAKAISSLNNYTISSSQRKTLLSGYPVAVKVDENYSCEGISVFKIPKRYSNTASHIIGYCNSSNDGICGIEQSYNDILKGKTIKVSFKTDVNGKVLSNTQTVENDTGYQGNGVMLTINRDIQSICEQEAKKYMTKGAVVVLDNATGKIRAMVSLPDYNPDNIEIYLGSDSSPFFNRAIAAYNCGSVFKLCTAAAALENNISLSMECKGFVKVGKNRFNCLAKHKKVSLADAVCVSCNSYFVKLGLKVGANNLYKTAKNFGFGVASKLCKYIVSESGSLPALSYLNSTPAELANFSFGQGRLMTTPLQIASMIQCIANNGKLIKPTLYEGITDSFGKAVSTAEPQNPTYVLKSDTAEYLQKCMIKTVNEGTGTTAKPENIRAGGKTATAQTGIYDKNGNEVFQTWFAGFYPDEKPKYSIVVLCENGNSGSKSAAPVFKKIVERMFEAGC